VTVSLAAIDLLLTSRGWSSDGDAGGSLPVRLYRNRLYPGRQFTLPVSSIAPDFQDAVTTVLRKLADLEHTSPSQLAREAELAGPDHVPDSDDALVLRIVRPSGENEEAIPLSMARIAVEEAETLLLVGGRLAEAPASHYKRVDTRATQALVERAVFNHTRRGSFVLSVSCPVVAKWEQLGLDIDLGSTTQTRRTFGAIYSGIEELRGAMDEGRLDELTQDTLSSDRPVIAANLVECIANIVSAPVGELVAFAFEWSGVIPLSSKIRASSSFSFVPDEAKPLYAAAAKLRPLDERLSGRFVGTVEALRGDLVDPGQRAGWVELLVHLPTRGWTRASAELNRDQYMHADKAHIAGSQFVSIVGTLEPRPRVWQFITVEGFELVTP